MSVEKKVAAGRWKIPEKPFRYLRGIVAADGGVAGRYMAWKAQREAESADESSEM